MPVCSGPLPRLIIQLASHPQLPLVCRERRVSRFLRPRQLDEGRPDWGRGRCCHLRVSRVPNAVRTSHSNHFEGWRSRDLPICTRARIMRRRKWHPQGLLVPHRRVPRARKPRSREPRTPHGRRTGGPVLGPHAHTRGGLAFHPPGNSILPRHSPPAIPPRNGQPPAVREVLATAPPAEVDQRRGDDEDRRASYRDAGYCAG